jgi:tRNA pseudouridine32 synthase/23S rRNA pseudouridine746 synthase
VAEGDSPGACDFISMHTGLSKTRIKEAMNKGAVWLKRRGRGRIRLRKATFRLQKGDTLEMCYDPKVLALEPPKARCLKDFTHYSLWFKPSDLLTQGTDFGDHGSLLRQVETHFNPPRKALPVHRLDREASGLLLVAHTREAAGRLSALFQEKKIIKRYRAEVSGIPEKNEGVILEPLNGKDAVTKYRVVSRNPETLRSTVVLEIETGRLHQIRRHLAGIGHPVMGDPRYGQGNKDGKPMRLTAYEMEWICPFTRRLEMHVTE